jgi:type III secretion system low calcium response chaperone LcrH/SycD
MDIHSLDLENMDIGKIQDVLQRINFKAGKQAEEALKTIMEHVLKKGILPKTALKISDDTMEAIYTQAYNLYNQGKYKESSYIFRLLSLLDFTMPKYALGLAACTHRMKEYKHAANLYFLCAALDPTNPMPHYHAADCYINLGTIALAIVALTLAINAAADQKQYAVLKERATLLKNGLLAQAKELAEKQNGKDIPPEAETTPETAKIDEKRINEK